MTQQQQTAVWPYEILFRGDAQGNLLGCHFIGISADSRTTFPVAIDEVDPEKLLPSWIHQCSQLLALKEQLDAQAKLLSSFSERLFVTERERDAAVSISGELQQQVNELTARNAALFAAFELLNTEPPNE